MVVFRSEKGQGTVEAAVAIPVLFLLLLVLLQPGIVLYDRLVMGNAAAEGCRLLTTATSEMTGSCEAFIRHRLAAVPQHECFMCTMAIVVGTSSCQVMSLLRW